MRLTRAFLKIRLFFLCEALPFVGGANGAELLVNPGFEEPVPTSGWEVNTYGAHPKFNSDAAQVREGKASLRVQATEASDTALAQEVILLPLQWYRYSAWVRTASLDPKGSPVSATVQVQRPKGAGLIAGGVSQSGDSEWTRAAVYFQAPSDGRVRLCLFFVGFGRGTGTVWFDDVRVEPADLSGAPIKVTREPLLPAQIHPMQYGQFVEYLCDLVPSMWAEKLYDGSFEGLSPYKFAFIAQTDFKEKPWYPSGAVNRGRYTLDKSTKMSGEVSQKIQVIGVAPCTLGISQDGIALERGKPVDFKCWLKASSLAEPVRVMLLREAKVLSEGTFIPGQEWKRFQTRLKPVADEINATLTIQFRGPGTLWIDDASLMPAQSVHGWRPEVVEAVRAQKPGIIRFGGSALDEPGFGEFEWRDTIGDPEHRKPFRAWGGLQPTGPGLEEFVRFCQEVHAEPMICVRFSNRKPQSAAEEVEYFNGATSTPMGALRAQNGHAEAYRIKYWQVGNERQSKEYDADLPTFCRAMKAVDPSISILSSFPTAGSVRNAAAWIDYVCPHHYTPDLAASESSLSSIRQLLRDNAGGRAIKVAVTEWNTTAGDWGLGRAKLMTLANGLACARYQNLLHRNCDLVEIANRSNLINSFGSGFIQVDNHRLYKTPAYYAQFLYSTLGGNQPVKIEATAPTNVGVDFSATLDTKSDRLILFAVNDSSREIRRRVDLNAFAHAGRKVTVWTLSDSKRAGEPDARNSFAEPERVAIRKSSLKRGTGEFDYSFPALSLTVLSY